MNYFDLFKVRMGFDIDLVDLEAKYLTLQKESHNYTSDNSNVTSIFAAVDINKSYEILKDDIKRCEYLFSLFGVNLDDYKLSQSFYEYILEVSDDIDDAEGEERDERIDELEIEIQEVRQILIESLSNLTIHDELDSDIIQVFLQFKYLRSIATKLHRTQHNILHA